MTTQKPARPTRTRAKAVKVRPTKAWAAFDMSGDMIMVTVSYSRSICLYKVRERDFQKAPYHAKIRHVRITPIAGRR